MQYLTDLANKLAATYENEKGMLTDQQALEKRKVLVATLRRALELEATPENLAEQSANPFSEYNTSDALFATARSAKV